LQRLFRPIGWKPFLNGGPLFLQVVENAIVGPLIAVASLYADWQRPLASVLVERRNQLWRGSPRLSMPTDRDPLILIYRKYYGTRQLSLLSQMMFISMVVAGNCLSTLFFSAARPERPRKPSEAPSLKHKHHWDNKESCPGPVVFSVDQDQRDHDQVGIDNETTPPKLIPPLHRTLAKGRCQSSIQNLRLRLEDRLSRFPLLAEKEDRRLKKGFSTNRRNKRCKNPEIKSQCHSFRAWTSPSRTHLRLGSTCLHLHFHHDVDGFPL